MVQPSRKKRRRGSVLSCREFLLGFTGVIDSLPHLPHLMIPRPCASFSALAVLLQLYCPLCCMHIPSLTFLCGLSSSISLIGCFRCNGVVSYHALFRYVALALCVLLLATRRATYDQAPSGGRSYAYMKRRTRRLAFCCTYSSISLTILPARARWSRVTRTLLTRLPKARLSCDRLRTIRVSPSSVPPCKKAKFSVKSVRKPLNS